MKILVACECSSTVTNAFRSKGHEAFSCDIKPSEDSSPWHIQADVLEVLNEGWDLLIAHPPCTHLASSGARWFKDKVTEQRDAIEFFMKFAEADIERICIENPVGVMSRFYRKPDQIVHPWMFGDSYTKQTCLWLKNLPKLEPTDIVDKGEFYVSPSGVKVPAWYSNQKKSTRSTERSRTFPGIAEAMASQWNFNL